MYKGGEFRTPGISKETVLVVLLFSMFTVGSSDYVSLTHDSEWQWNPSISGSVVTWEDNRSGNLDIYIYDLTMNKEIRITQDKTRQGNPSIYGDIVIWTDERNGNADIYGYNLRTRSEFPITTNFYDQTNPHVYKDIVVWQDYRNGNADIYGYNLKTSEEFQITINSRDQKNPKIHQNFAVWEDHRNGNGDIYYYNLSTKKEFQVTFHPSYQGNPCIYGDIIVWEDHRNGNSDIYMYNLSSKKETRLTKNSRWQGNSAIFDQIVLWVDGRKGSIDIYGYNLTTNREFQITRDPILSFSVVEYDPQIYGMTVVWANGENTNTDIYLYEIPERAMYLFSPYGDAIFPIILILALLLIFRKEITLIPSIVLGIVFGVITMVLEESYIDFGTVLLLGGAPLLSVLLGLLSESRLNSIITIFSTFVIVFVLDASRIHVGMGALFVALFWAALYSILGLGISWVFKERIKKPRKLRGLSCPGCGKKIEKSWNICPYCKTNLDYTKLYDDKRVQ